MGLMCAFIRLFGFAGREGCLPAEINVMGLSKFQNAPNY